MNTIFLYTAAIGGTFLVLQFLMLLFGAGGDHDLGSGGGGHFAGHGGGHLGGDADAGGHEVGHDQGSFLKLFSLQTISAFATFFGLIGLATEHAGWSPASVTAAATLSGCAALWVVARVMHALAGLQSSGNVDLRNAIGHQANVYLRVPAAGRGHGRVLVQVQGRTVECRALSRGAEIPTGAAVRVVEHQDDDMLVVEPVH